MTAPEARSLAPEARVEAPSGLEPVVLDTVRAPARAGVDQARSHLAATVDALHGWYTRRTDPGHTYVQDGHEAIHLIDAATRALYQVRAVLVGEIRADEDERAAWVDRLLADPRAERAAGEDTARPGPDGPGRNGGTL
jgi:hypothetical protein